MLVIVGHREPRGDISTWEGVTFSFGYYNRVHLHILRFCRCLCRCIIQIFLSLKERLACFYCFLL